MSNKKNKSTSDEFLESVAYERAQALGRGNWLFQTRRITGEAHNKKKKNHAKTVDFLNKKMA